MSVAGAIENGSVFPLEIPLENQSYFRWKFRWKRLVV